MTSRLRRNCNRPEPSLPKPPAKHDPPGDPTDGLDPTSSSAPSLEESLAVCAEKWKASQAQSGGGFQCTLEETGHEQKDQLALLVAKRGVVVFRDQEIGPEGLHDLAAYYGPLHIHSVGGSLANDRYPGSLVVWNDGTKPLDQIAYDLENSGWHSDQTFEINTPGLTSLKIINGPKTGGDTCWASGYVIYSQFSPQMQTYLETLYALHSSDQQKRSAEERGVYIRRPQADCIHPVVRVHPVTGMKSIFVNGSYTRRIIGIPKAESDAVLRMIYDMIA
ncbi:TauD-domain-containing protein [Calocera viscosa TUFC12733]|uniref:TauD-domain-containing protein n=1 Tax=Calocera viscosa (strain TUFC12733) TaxID=1330018 RepID=A0A167FIV9_CALVF|nr:TauD-domain-containing protein [Calocera viscosa TUFC12733]